MLTKDDKKFISEILDVKINNALDKRFKENNDVLIKDMIDLFNATNSVIEKVDSKLSDKIDGVEKSLNEKIDKVNINLSEKIDDTNERIDKIFEHLSEDFDSIENLEKRTGKLEEKVFTATISS